MDWRYSIVHYSFKNSPFPVTATVTKRICSNTQLFSDVYDLLPPMWLKKSFLCAHHHPPPAHPRFCSYSDFSSGYPSQLGWNHRGGQRWRRREVEIWDASFLQLGSGDFETALPCSYYQGRTFLFYSPRTSVIRWGTVFNFGVVGFSDSLSEGVLGLIWTLYGCHLTEFTFFLLVKVHPGHGAGDNWRKEG